MPWPSAAPHRTICISGISAFLSLCLGTPGRRVQARAPATGLDAAVRATQPLRLDAESTLGDLLHHPAFTGFERLLLPWDDRAYDEQMPLTRIGSLLPYHTHVDAATVANALNRLIDEAAGGKTVFYRFYSDAQVQQDPAKAKTGLFFFRGRPGASFAVIAPGGGFSYVASVHEGFPYAETISREGYNAFVLKYRVGSGGGPAIQDLAAAVSYIFANAAALDVDTGGYSLWGSSAGARMAASIGSHGVSRFGGTDLPGPSAVVMAYTGHSDHAAHEPPTFVVVGEDDGIAPPVTMKRRVEALRKAGTEVEYREYPAVGHGFGLGVGTRAEGWISDAIQFWNRSRAELRERARPARRRPP